MMEKINIRVEVNNNADFVISLSEAKPKDQNEPRAQVYFEKGSLIDDDDVNHKPDRRCQSGLNYSILMKDICKKAIDDDQIGFRKVFCPDNLLNTHDTNDHKEF